MEPRDARGSSCEESTSVQSRGLGPEFIYPFLVLVFATVLRKLLRYVALILTLDEIELVLVGIIVFLFRTQ